MPVVLHQPDVREAELSMVECKAGFFAAGANLLILGASTGLGSYEQSAELEDESWSELFDTLPSIEETGARHGLRVTLHPHYGTAIERPHHVHLFLNGCDMGLCLDTGHLVIGGSDPLRVVERAADRVKLVHLKGVDRDLAKQIATRELSFREAARRRAFRPLGEGDVDVGRLINLLEQAWYRGWYVLEQDIVVDAEPEEGEGPVLNVRKSVEFLEESLAEVPRGDQETG